MRLTGNCLGEIVVVPQSKGIAAGSLCFPITCSERVSSFGESLQKVLVADASVIDFDVFSLCKKRSYTPHQLVLTPRLCCESWARHERALRNSNALPEHLLTVPIITAASTGSIPFSTLSPIQSEPPRGSRPAGGRPCCQRRVATLEPDFRGVP